VVSIAENAAYEATRRDLTGEQAACLSLWRPGPGNDFLNDERRLCIAARDLLARACQ
jgi:hypothetical protein